MKTRGGKKFDSEKLQWHLLPWPLVEEVIKVLMFGAHKYGEENWKHVADGEKRYWNAALRHLTSKGKDPETGLSHYAHAACSILFAWWHHKDILKMVNNSACVKRRKEQ